MIKQVKSHMLVCLALLLLVGGTAYANTQTPDDPSSASEPDVEVSDPDVADGSLAAPAAGCQLFGVRGTARVKGSSAVLKSYETTTSFIDTRSNCSGGQVKVRRESTGHYYVWFVGNASRQALGISNSDGQGTNSARDDNVVSIARMTSGPDSGAFRVEVEDVDGGGTHAEDAWFTIVAF